MPAVCDVSVTNACNAACAFCSFSRDKARVRPLAWIDPERFADALPIMYRRGIRHLTFQGGEPLLHPAIEALISDARSANIPPEYQDIMKQYFHRLSEQPKP